MKTSSATPVLSPAKARNCALINQLATPGLGSLMARRYIAGAGQLLLALVAAGFIFAWFFAVISQMWQQLDSDRPAKSLAWIGETGAVIFALSWVWALVTSMSLLRQARSSEASLPPKIDET